jgi:hypothetical protein
MQGDISDQSCCSYLYSKVFSKKCCCAWLDNKEVFRAVHKKSIILNNFLKFKINIFLFIFKKKKKNSFMVKIKFGHVMAVLMDSHARNRKKLLKSRCNL